MFSIPMLLATCSLIAGPVSCSDPAPSSVAYYPTPVILGTSRLPEKTAFGASRATLRTVTINTAR